MLDRNPKTRLGATDKEQIKRDPFFEGIDWDRLYKKQYQPPITEFENSDIEDEFDDIADKVKQKLGVAFFKTFLSPFCIYVEDILRSRLRIAQQEHK